MILQTNIDGIRAEIMQLESATMFDASAWLKVLTQLVNSPCRLADARRRMETARTNALFLIDDFLFFPALVEMEAAG